MVQGHCRHCRLYILSSALVSSLSLTLREAAIGTGCSEFGRRASPAVNGSFLAACSHPCLPLAGNPKTHTACGRPSLPPLFPEPQPSSCLTWQILERVDREPWRCLFHGSESPQTCGGVPRCCRLLDLAPPRCPPPGLAKLPPRNKSLWDQNKEVIQFRLYNKPSPAICKNVMACAALQHLSLLDNQANQILQF